MKQCTVCKHVMDDDKEVCKCGYSGYLKVVMKCEGCGGEFELSEYQDDWSGEVYGCPHCKAVIGEEVKSNA